MLSVAITPCFDDCEPTLAIKAVRPQQAPSLPPDSSSRVRIETRWNVISRLSRHKVWFGKLVSVVTMIASFTFFGEKAIMVTTKDK
jgi:hypothetical protein